MFGDGSWLEDRTAAQERAFATWLDSLDSSHSPTKPRLVILELGAGTAVPTVRRCGETLAARFGATLLRINPDLPTHPGDGSASVASVGGPSVIALPQSALAALQALAATRPAR